MDSYNKPTEQTGARINAEQTERQHTRVTFCSCSDNGIKYRKQTDSTALELPKQILQCCIRQTL